jgi:pyruvate dehydrogenase E2 component (dihydrolipoyllysine-residue acetyltransferase)
MPIELKMPALSPTMEQGNLTKWLVKEGDKVVAGDILAEIETDKATMEYEAVDDGTVAKILVPEGSSDVKIGTVIALLAGEGEDVKDVDKQPSAPPAEAKKDSRPAAPKSKAEPKPAAIEETMDVNDRIKASPLARRVAEQQGVDLAKVEGSGPGGRIVKADVEGGAPQAAPAPAPTAQPAPAVAQPAPAAAPAAAAQPAQMEGPVETPHDAVKLSSMRKVIARRLTESKQTVPHIYLTVDIQLDKLLKLRGELNTGLEARGIKLSVNDLLIKALAAALMQVPECNVSFAGDKLLKYKRVDISVAVSIPGGLITPIIFEADTKPLSTIAIEMKDLAARARDGKLLPSEYQGGTASISNMGMFGIKQFDAVINPPQGMIMAIGAGEKRPYVINDSLQIATVMSATGSFDHRAIDGADGARLMDAFKRLVENPIAMLA